MKWNGVWRVKSEDVKRKQEAADVNGHRHISLFHDVINIEENVESD
jgi:hypothetical protein